MSAWMAAPVWLRGSEVGDPSADRWRLSRRSILHEKTEDSISNPPLLPDTLLSLAHDTHKTGSALQDLHDQGNSSLITLVGGNSKGTKERAAVQTISSPTLSDRLFPCEAQYTLQTPSLRQPQGPPIFEIPPSAQQTV